MFPNKLKADCLIAGALLVLSGVQAFAQSTIASDVNYLHLLPNNEQVQRAISSERAKMAQDAVVQQAPTKNAIEAEQARQKPLTKETLDEASRQASGRVQVPTLPSMSVYGEKAHSPDPTELATKYIKSIQGNEDGLKKAPVIREWQSKAYVFISTSMPMDSLVKYAESAKKIGVPLVIRGIPNGVAKSDWQAFNQLMQPVANTGVELLVHPVWFERYHITAVPALVVAPNAVEGCAEGSCEAGSVRVLGDASLELGLEEISRRATHSEARKITEKLLAALRERSVP